VLKSLLKKLPPIAALVAERDGLMKASGFVPPGHFYSPVVAIEEAKRDEQRIFSDAPRTLPGIDLNEAQQLENMEIFENIYPSIDFPETKSSTHRYYYENRAYSYSDAIMLHCMMRHIKPKKIIEVGSGHSSCVMLDTNEMHLNKSVQFTFIEPYPALLKSLVRADDLRAIDIVESRLQDVAVDRFSQLSAGDFLFIDSTHVSKTGSDVNYLLFEILPALKAGVYIHIHDIFYPFEYPKEWVFGGRSWNEIYALRAFLQFNARFTIEMMNTFLEHFHRQRFAERMPLCLKNTGGSIWLRKQ
jgi:predicted O-methyltransferase YrrM